MVNKMLEWCSALILAEHLDRNKEIETEIQRDKERDLHSRMMFLWSDQISDQRKGIASFCSVPFHGGKKDAGITQTRVYGSSFLLAGLWSSSPGKTRFGH